MLTIFRRHRRRCPHAARGRDWRRCSCPISVEGTLPLGESVRKTLNTGSWELASEMVRGMEAGGPSAAIKVEDAIERFLADATARNLADSSMKKYRVLLQGATQQRHVIRHFGGICAGLGLSAPETVGCRRAT